MIFTCPVCGIVCNVRKLPVNCCGVRHDESSTALVEGNIDKAAKPSRTPRINPRVIEPCVYRSKESIREWCSPCKGYLLTYHCEHFNEPCFIGKTVNDVRSCHGCKARRNPVVIDSDLHGFGDAMVAAWISEGAKHEGKQVMHYALGDKAEFLRLFGQETTNNRPLDVLSTLDFGNKEMRSRGRESRLSVRAKSCRVETPVRPTPLPITPEVAAWRDSVADDKTVLLYPQSVDTSRTWPMRHWRKLRRMLRDDGYTTQFVMPVPQDGINSLSFTWQQNIALMQVSKLVICNDSGSAHVAGTLDVPTLAVCGPTGQSGVFDHMPSVRPISVSPDTIPCVGCCYGVEFEPACRRECKALGLTTPEQVFKAAKEML